MPNPSAALVRPISGDDVEQAAELLHDLLRAFVQTGESILHRQTSEPPRARRASWVALEEDVVVGYATAYFKWFGGEVGNGRTWVGVREECRRRGIGTELWDIAAAHLSGAKKLTVEIDDDPAGLRYVEKRGFTQYDAEIVSKLDPRGATPEVEQQPGFRVAPLTEVRGRAADLFEFYGAAGGFPPGDPANRVSLDEWRTFILENPILDPEGSVVVVDADDRIVSLSWLLVDPLRHRAENEWTATLPELRGRGLARLAKVATIRWAAENGIEEIVTGNDRDNLPMRELNRQLGYRELFVRRDYERLRTPSGA